MYYEYAWKRTHIPVNTVTNLVSHLLLLRRGVLVLLCEGKGLADVREDVALKEEGVVLWLKLETVALEGCLLCC